MADNPNLENLLQMGITAAKQGNKDGARVLLRQVIEGDKKNDRAWLWMASVAENTEKRKQYLETALRINPHNDAAKKQLTKLEKKRSRGEQRTLQVGLVVLLLVMVVSLLMFLVVVLAR